MSDFLQQVRAAVFGHALADALGVPVEFCSREELRRNPVTGMRGYGTYHMPKGSWSDDTTMNLAALDSLSRGIDYEDVMKKFVLWVDEAAYTPTDKVFDIGNATTAAIESYKSGLPALRCGGTGEHDNGNGSLMRIIPYVLFAHAAMGGASLAERLHMIHEASSVTHAHPCSKMGCGIYACILWELLKDPSAASVRKGLETADSFYRQAEEFESDFCRYERVFDPGFASLPEDAIKSSGFVVSSLEAALWCLLNTDNYTDCVLKAVNLGSDTDTVAAIAGGMAGLLYGYEAIPEAWLQDLLKRDYIEELCRRFAGSL